MWNRRVSNAVMGIAMAVLSLACLSWVPGSTGPAAEEPPPPRPPGIFSEVGGWITYGDKGGIWAVDPTRPGGPNDRIQLSTERGTPLAWSSDGSKLLILAWLRPRSTEPVRLYVLNADGTETTLTTINRRFNRWGGLKRGSFSGGSFSPDGFQVVYATTPDDTWRDSIYVVDSDGGTPRLLLSGGRRWYPSAERSILSWLSDPTYSADGAQIAYFDHQFDGPSQLRVMNADGSGTRVLLDGTGYHIYNLDWSPDGERLAWGSASGIFVVDADGSGLSLMIRGVARNGGADPYWSPDGTRIAYRIEDGSVDEACPRCPTGTLEVAAPDGTQVQEFGYAEPGPWNPLVQPVPAVAELPSASEGLPMTSTLLLVVTLLALAAGAALIRRRMVQRS